MSFDLAALRAAVDEHGRVIRVVIARIRGSSPREVGASMLVWPGGQSGTIGGGALEYQAAERARTLDDDCLSQHALGPELGQCCGGHLSLLSEVYDTTRLDGLEGPIVARPAGRAAAMPLSVQRLLAQARNAGAMPTPGLYDGWMVEQVHAPTRSLWIWGAGHVGRALVSVMAPLPDFDITWVDTSADRFPTDIPSSVTCLPAAEPSRLMAHAPHHAEHLIVTYSHALDLDLCHGALTRGFRFAGLIGSATKWARFRARRAALGHAPEVIGKITCPIGQPQLGKHPQAIALGVGTALLTSQIHTSSVLEKRA